MSNAGHLPPKVKPSSAKEANNHHANHKGSGRVGFDSRGTAVWEWKTETGSFSRDINTQRLKKLEAHELEIEQTGKLKKPSGLSASDDTRSRGFNPYDHDGAKKKPVDPYQVHYAKTQTIKTSLASERKPIKDLKAYGEWLAMKKRLASQKDDK